MITLPSKITIVTSSVEVSINPSYTITDNPNAKIVSASFLRIPRPLVLWSGDAYDQIGNWTQEQADQRITELLGDSPEAVLKTLLLGVRQ